MGPEATAQDDGIEEAFKVFDKDGNGFISTDELRGVMQSIDAQSSDEMIKQADTSGDGQIDIEEFLQILKTEGSEIMPPRLDSPTIT